MSITSETRKRLWGRSGNTCAVCRAELVRPDDDELPGALIGEEAHIVGRSPGGPRYEPLEPATRDGYDNLILLCANDHTEVDAQSTRYTVENLRARKRRHEMWVKARLHTPAEDSGPTLALSMQSGDELWPLLSNVYGWSLGTPDHMTEAEEDLIDEVLQTVTDWCDISSDVDGQGLKAVRQAKRSITGLLDELNQSGFVLLAGQRQAAFAGGSLVGPALVLEVVRSEDLDGLRVPGPDE